MIWSNFSAICQTVTTTFTKCVKIDRFQIFARTQLKLNFLMIDPMKGLLLLSLFFTIEGNSVTTIFPYSSSLNDLVQMGRWFLETEIKSNGFEWHWQNSPVNRLITTIPQCPPGDDLCTDSVKSKTRRDEVKIKIARWMAKFIDFVRGAEEHASHQINCLYDPLAIEP